MDITCNSKGERICIYFDEVLHLSLTAKDLQVHSWKSRKNWYCIEFTTENGIITAEYNSKEKWSKVLSLIDNELP